ncbi:MAG: methionine gamma-lyase family protein [Clostridia bacterium]|nr:methionine gamma-lyase family protein [Clostridia bacterium]
MDPIKAKELIAKAEIKAKTLFDLLSEVALQNQQKVLDGFIKNRVNATHFYPSTGYGYDDNGRDCLNRLYADVFHTESAIVSPSIANGTHALTLALFGILRPGDVLFSVAGKPYDTLDEVISGTNNGSLKEFNVRYEQADLLKDGQFDKDKISSVLRSEKIKLIFIQRSKGYLWRNALSVNAIKNIVDFIKEIDKNVIIMVDNCYGEFVEIEEPTDVGADLIVGSLIKNPGGGIAPTGGYIAGKKDLIEQISYRLTAPSLGNEVGSYIGGYRLYYQGLFLAPSVVKNTLMGNVLASYVLDSVGCDTMPNAGDRPYDIINSIRFSTGDELVRFVQSVQSVSPVDSYVTPEPWDMPGYTHPVIMAAGTFVQGASIELSADGTVRDPYIAYLQGGLTYEHCKLALQKILEKVF